MQQAYTYMYTDAEAFGIHPAPQFRWQRGSRYVELGINAGPGQTDLLQNVPESGFGNREEFVAWCREALDEMGPQEAHRLAWGMREASRRTTRFESPEEIIPSGW